MYPWKEAFHSLAVSTKLQVNALGLINILGTDEVDVSVGRLVPSRCTEFMPLSGAFILASNRFTQNQPNFVLYNLTDKMTTTELSGWFTRWLKAQDFHQVHHKIQWEVRESPVSTISRICIALALSIPCNGMLLALTVLSADWWGFTNVVAMIVSVVVRVLLVWQNRTGIDDEIDRHQPKESEPPATVVVIMDDSRVIKMNIPRRLVKPIFTQCPKVPYPVFYRLTRAVGWVAFGIHIVSIGMASLPTQIYTVFLVLGSTILTSFKVGCEDWRMGRHIAHRMKLGNWQENAGVSCSISSRLTAICSEYSQDYDDWVQGIGDDDNSKPNASLQRPASSSSRSSRQRQSPDPEAQTQQLTPAVSPQGRPRTTRRQDLFVWLDLSSEEQELMIAWNAMPSDKNMEWWDEFKAKQKRWKTCRENAKSKQEQGEGPGARGERFQHDDQKLDPQ